VFAVPNGGRRNKFEAFNLKQQGVRPGVSDLIILKPNGKAIFVELKSDTGRQSQHQKDFQKVCERFGFEYFLCKTLDHFMELVK